MASEEKVFIPHLTECWAPAVVLGPMKYKLIDPCDVETTDSLITVTYDAAAWTKLKAVSVLSNTLPATVDKASTILAPVVDPLEGQDNIADLQFVSEGSVLHAIRCRYKKKAIYTNVGRIVIALNPFERRPELYEDAVIMRYSKCESPYALPPHVYQVAAGAFKGMSDDNINQSTLITGESGAGKTESTKLLLKYFAFLGNPARASAPSAGGTGEKATIEQKIMKANPILEAFGNASTSRNPNSSRFGKWIEILFDPRSAIKGASITSYMLEMPRICEHLHCDRGYHIFYQVVAHKLGGTSGNFKDYAFLTPTPPPAGVVTKGHGQTVNDTEMYNELVQAFKDFEFTANEQGNVFQLIACILFLGNIKFEAASIKGGEGSIITPDSEKALAQAATLLGTDAATLTECMISKKITTGKETMTVPQKPLNATGARDSLAKLIYGSLFNWLLSRINMGLAAPAENYKSIGVLDIAGFERFDVNSFEQLLINLSNEKLQQHFNNDIILAELEDYKKEGVVELQLDYADNSKVLSLVEGKGGIMDILDEELFVPKGTDAGFASKLSKTHAKTPHFVAPKFTGDPPTFGVSHFAGVVTYTATGWLDKNRLAPPREAFETLNSANNNVVKQMIKLVITDSKKVTVGGSFKKQLAELMAKIKATQTHYVRCIKPNATHKPGLIESQEMLRQLKCAGIMEAIKIRKSGFSLRVTFEDFAERYAILVGIEKPRTKATCEEIVSVAKARGKITEKDVVMANTKVMAKESVRELLDHMRLEAIETLKRPLVQFIDAYDAAVLKQNGMFLYPQPLLGPDIDTPASLEKKLRLLENGLLEVEKKLGTLENPPGWVGGALLVRDAMRKEIEVVTEANTVLCDVKPLCCDAALINRLQAARDKALTANVTNGACEKINQLLDLIAEEKDWETQLGSADTDRAALLKEIKDANREFLTPGCHKAVAEAQARINAKARKQADEERAAQEASAKAKAEVEARRSASFQDLTQADPGLLKSDSRTAADDILSQVQPKLPPARDPSMVFPLGKKALIARSVPKRGAVAKPVQRGNVYQPRVKHTPTNPPPKAAIA